MSGRIACRSVAFAAAILLACAAAAQEGAPAPAPPPAPAPFAPSEPLGDGPWDLQTEEGSIKVSVVAKGLDHPWAMAFLPGGHILVTERPGRLRVIRDGKLDPVAIAGLPPIWRNLMGLALHPDFARNRLVYFSYSKPGDPLPEHSTLAVARARWDGGMRLADVEEIFVADAWFGQPPLPERCCGQGPPAGSFGARIAFGPDGKLYVASGDRNWGERAQDPSVDFGKILRLNDDGSVPADNPFVGKAGWKPEIFSLGHRNPSGLHFHPATGELWESEFGPRGGGEVNLIRPGGNYGWIDVTQGYHYDGAPAKGVRGVPGMIDPVLTWPAPAPSINPGGLDFYLGDRFPGWSGDLLMATMSRSILRASFGANGQPAHQERFLTELRQRYRDIKIGPDVNLYVLTDETAGAVLKIEPGA
jgi:glucose/arabinose dehydrogenase